MIFSFAIADNMATMKSRPHSLCGLIPVGTKHIFRLDDFANLDNVTPRYFFDLQ